jgi:GNAT superfamily N-acetyltransferase
VSEQPPPLLVRDIPLDATTDLRTRVLRNHLPGLPTTAPVDSLSGTWHLGAFRGSRLVGVVTGFVEDAPDHPGLPAQRFRYMAVEPSEQGRGVGAALMQEVIARARARGDVLLWAKGRDSALDFYRRLGFEVIGESFINDISQLPHHLVLLTL